MQSEQQRQNRLKDIEVEPQDTGGLLKCLMFMSLEIGQKSERDPKFD